MSVNITTAGSEVQINICTVGATITFRRNSSTEVDAAAMADVVKRAIADLTASEIITHLRDEGMLVEAGKIKCHVTGKTVRLVTVLL